LSGRVTPGERIKHEIVGFRKKLDEKARQFSGKSGGVYPITGALTFFDIGAV
jgi:hypothetical protein